MKRKSVKPSSRKNVVLICALLLGSAGTYAFSTQVFSFGTTIVSAAEALVSNGAEQPSAQIHRRESGDRPVDDPKAVAANDKFIYGLGDLPLSFATRRDKIFSLAPGGSPQELANTTDFEPSWSPDGKKIVFVSLRDALTNSDANRNIYKMNADGSDQERLSSGPFIGGEAQPSFSYHTNPSQQKIVYVADYTPSGHQVGIYTITGSGTPVRLNTDACFEEEPPEDIGKRRSNARSELNPGIYGFDTPNFSPDNQFIIFGYPNFNDAVDIYRIGADGSTCTLLYEGEDSYAATTARYSRDGTKIALYHRDGDGFDHKLRIINATTGVLLQEFEPTNFFGSPVWSPNPGENKIAYLAGDQNPDNPMEGLEIRTIDLTTGLNEQVFSQGVPYGLRGMDWGIPSTTVPPLSMRINQPHPLQGGMSTTGTVNLATTAPAGGVTITLLAGNPVGQTIISLPSTSLFIPEGQTQANFQIDAPVRTPNDHRSIDIFASRPSPNAASAKATVSVWPARGDLKANTFTAPASAAPGANINISYTIQNIGPVTTSGVGTSGGYDYVYFSADDQIGPEDGTPIRQSSNNPALAAGATRTITNASVNIAASRAPSAGQYFLILKTNAHPSQTVYESDYTNNIIARPITIELPDLVPENLVLPPLVQPGVTYPVSWTTRNIGTIASAASSSQLYYSPDATFGDANDIVLDTVTNTALAPNATQNHNTSFNIPTVPARADGTAYFYVRVDYNNVVYEGLSSGTGENNNTTSANRPFEYRVADLQVPSMSAPVEVETETAFAMEWTTTNAGNRDATPFDDRVFFSLDNQVGSDIALGTFQLSGGLAAGASVQRIQNVTIPTSAIAASGNYFVYVKTDGDTDIDEGVNENNNIRFQPVFVRRLLRPDLVVSNITAPPTAFFDQTIQVQWTVTNNGQGPTNAPQWKDTLYIGTSPTSTSGASKLADVNSVSALNPGESYTASAIVKVPRGLNGGYHFLVRTNSNSAVNEESTTNNLFSDPVQVNVPPLPDLIVETVQAPDEVFGGQEISINYSVRNIGTEDAGFRKDRIYFSRDTVLNTSQDKLVFTSDSVAGPLAGQLTSHISRNRIGVQNPPVYQLARVPSNLEGLWYVFVVTDYSNDVYEFTAENNNVNHDSVEPGSPINVLVTPPDLVVPNEPAAPATVASGTSVPVTFTVRNQGAFNAAPNLYHAVYLSTDQTFNSGTDIVVGSIKDTNFFPPAGEHPFTMNVSLPNCLADGTYYLFAVADYDGRQFEFDPNFDAEANNASPARPIQLSTVPPDLQVTSLQVPPITTPGQIVSVNWTVSNLGGPTSRNWIDRVYLRSLNPGISPQTLGSFERTGGLASGASYTESRVVGLPSFMEGEYYLSITTDVSNYVPECGTADNNNSANSSNFSVQNNLPDLVIDSVTAPSAAVVGDSFTVQWTGRNANQAIPSNSSSWRDYVYLSSNPTLSNGDIYLGGALNETILAGGQTYPQQATVQIGNVAAGTYYILVVADGGTDIYEGTSGSGFEANNVRASGPITLTSPAVDLQVGNVSVSLPHHSGTYRNISWTVTNVGATQTLATQWSDYVIMSRDAVLDSTDTTLGYVTRTTALAGGENYTGSGDFFVPSGLTGEYRIFVITDKNNGVVENNNSNNTSPPVTINLTLPPPAELSITNITPPPTTNLGGNATFSWIVQNTGANAVIGKWRDTVYLSRDQFWDASDILVGVRDLDSQTTSVPAGIGTYAASFSGLVPPVEEGTYYVIVRTDSQNRIRETNEGNNVTTSVGTTAVTITELQLNTPLNATLGNGAQQFFKYTTEPAETLVFSLTTDMPGRSNEAFTKFGTVVSRADHDFQSSRPGEGNQENVITETQEGKYFSMVRTDLIPGSFAENFDKSPKISREKKLQPEGGFEPQNITVNARILPFTVRGVSPEEAGNAGYITLSVDGAKFQTGATLKLVGTGGVEILPANFRVLPTNILAVFDLRGKAAGAYDVVVRNPDNQTSTLDDGFTIINGGGAAEPRVSIDGPRFSRGGRSRYTFSFANDGLNDMYLVPLVIVMPSRYAYELDRSNYIGDLEDMLPPDAIPSQLPLHFDRVGMRVIALFTPLLASKRTVRVNIDVSLPFGFSGFEVGAMALPPFADWLRLSKQEQTESLARTTLTMGSGTEAACAAKRNSCLLELLRSVIFSVISEALPGDCVNVVWGQLAAGLDLTFGLLAKGSDLSVTDAIGSVASFIATTLGAFAVECLSVGIPWIKAISIALFTVKGLLDLYECHRGYNECLPPPPEVHPTEFLQSFDPNEMIGPKGYGGEGFVPIGQPLTYRINFENLSSANAPAQLIRITDVLPPPLDLRTVRLKEIGFKQNRIVIPSNQSFYQSRVQLGEDLGNLQADILAGVDLVNNRIFWNIQAIDPNTSEAPLDPFAGILPPNNANQDGEGYVIFTVEARNTFPNRTAINNFATIIFDENEPIVTNTVTNLLDSVVPVSQIAPLPLTSDTPDFNLSWTSSDDTDGSGYEGTRLMFSEDGQPYKLYASSLASTATFMGRWGKSYRFYSLGYDNAGNGELPPTLPDATITILGGDTEGDLAPRPNGNDGQVNDSDLTQVRRFVAGLDSDYQYNEFQRVDMAPRDVGGNGGLTASDIVQARRYAAGLDTRAEAAGPNQAAAFTPKTVTGKSSAAGLPRELKPVRLGRIGNKLYVAVNLEAQGDEVAVGFTLNFSTSDLSNPANIQLGTGAGPAILTVNDSQAAQGRLGFILDKAPNDPIPAGARQLITLEFDIPANPQTTTIISFGNGPVFDEVANGLAVPVQTTLSPATILVMGPTAAGVTILGRVMNGTRGISKATVLLTDPNGTALQARTNNFGYFRFNDVPAGQTYVVSVSAKRYTFSPRVLSVTDDISDLVFTPEEAASKP